MRRYKFLIRIPARIFWLPLTEFGFRNNIIYNVKREKSVGFHKTPDFFPVIQLLY